MKHVIVSLSFALFAFVSSVNAQSTLALQERCAEEAKKFFSKFKNQYRSDSGLWPDYSCHYNKKLDRCFIHISVLAFKAAKEEIISQYLYDVFEAGRQSKTLAFGMFQKFPDRTRTPVCKVGDKTCRSEVEFEALIKPYMEQ